MSSEGDILSRRTRLAHGFNRYVRLLSSAEEPGTGKDIPEGEVKRRPGRCHFSAAGLCSALLCSFLLVLGIFYIHILTAGRNFEPFCVPRASGDGVFASHRGDVRGGQENTWGAINATLLNGIPLAEIDITATSDDVLVLFHDKDTERLTGQPGTIRGRTWDEVSQLRVLADLPERSYESEQPIARLDDVLETFCPLGLGFVLDLKDRDLFSSDRYVNRLVLELLHATDACDGVDIRLAVGNPFVGRDLYQRQLGAQENGEDVWPVWFYYLPSNRTSLPGSADFWIGNQYLQWLSNSSNVYVSYEVYNEDVMNAVLDAGFCYGLYDLFESDVEALPEVDMFTIDFDL